MKRRAHSPAEVRCEYDGVAPLSGVWLQAVQYRVALRLKSELDMLDLEAIELIKQLKARYFRFIDVCDLVNLRDKVFAPDAQVHFKSPTYDIKCTGWPELEKFYGSAFTSQTFGMHQGHHPEITVTGNTATGLWYLHDIFVHLDTKTVTEGSAIYEDEYVKLDGQWRISASRYVRRLEMISPLREDVRVTARPIG